MGGSFRDKELLLRSQLGGLLGLAFKPRVVLSENGGAQERVEGLG
jgi:hypothetical protein